MHNKKLYWNNGRSAHASGRRRHGVIGEEEEEEGGNRKEGGGGGGNEGVLSDMGPPTFPQCYWEWPSHDVQRTDLYANLLNNATDHTLSLSLTVPIHQAIHNMRVLHHPQGSVFCLVSELDANTYAPERHTQTERAPHTPSLIIMFVTPLSIHG